ncbi:MAG: ATP-binding protein [Opitutales bacterium]
MTPAGSKKRKDFRAKFVFLIYLTAVIAATTAAYTGYIHPILQNLSVHIDDSREARENVSWNVHQLHSEIAKLKITALSEVKDPPFYSDLGLRYEVALSRVDLLKQGDSYQELAVALDSTDELWKISEQLNELQPIILAAEDGDESATEEIIEKVTRILEDTAAFALKTNQQYHRYVGEKREQALEQLAKSRHAVGTTTIVLAGTIIVLAIVLYISMNARRDAEIQGQLAKRNAQAKSRFLASMSHEIRTPLNAMLGFSKLATDPKNTNSPVIIEEYLQNIKGAGEQLSSLIESVLDWSKIESQKLDIETRPIDIIKQLEEFHNVYSATAKQKGKQIELIIDPDFPRYQKTDSTRLNQILTNLVGNALKFTEPDTSIRIRASVRGDQFYIAIEDEGIGIPNDKLWSIFNAFEQAESDTTRRFGGTGLGLAISKELAKLMGGDITVQSAIGFGSTFTLILPSTEISEPEIDEIKRAMSAELDLELDPDSVVLVVEDGILNQKLISVVFEKLGLKIHLANNGEEGVERTIELKPDLVLMDMQMPVMDGLTATRMIRETPEIAETPVVFLTANAFTEDRQHALLAGVDAFLTKPLQLEELKIQLSRYLKPKRRDTISA